MGLWARTRRLELLAASIVLVLVFALLAGDTRVGLPALGGDGDHPLLLFAPVIVCVGLATSLDSRLPSTEAVGRRDVLLFDRTTVLAAVLLVAVIGQLTGQGLGTLAPEPLGRDTAFLAGLMLCGARLIGYQAAALVPAAWVIAATVLGSQATGWRRLWTVIHMRPGQGAAEAIAVAVLLFGLAAQSGVGRPLAAPLERLRSRF